ncbi:ATP-binding protein [Nocardiopsis sediminis]|uniref:ATP-binding protein n=1 Tax=Nocardiopsis sediminis TaxID=1778267 RepID=A0ABV8FYC4_9ACTN
MAPQTAPARQNLPADSDSFIGRERDLSDLLRLLDTDRVVTLCGTGGMGKTRLALRVAAHAAASFPDGVWLAALAEASTQWEVTSRIAAALAVAEEPGRDLIETLCDSLSGRRLLLVLDSCDRAAAHVAAVGRILTRHCPEISLLLTAAEPVGADGESVRRVPPLSLPRSDDGGGPAGGEAVRLFLDRAGRAAPARIGDADLPAVAEICRLVEGNPLAIELAAAWTGRLAPALIAEGLAERLAPEAAGPGPRPPVVDTVLDWSHGLLSEPERVLLRRLAVFPDWDLELAERVCSGRRLRDTAVLDLLSALVERSLVGLTGEHRGRVRYRLPGPVRRFAAERLAESGEQDPVHERHCEQMALIVEELGRASVIGRAMPWQERFGNWERVIAEYDNIRAALHWAVSARRVRNGLRMCVGLRPFWVTGYHFSEGERWSGLFLDMPGGPALLRGRALVGRSELAWARHDLGPAVRLAEEGMRIGRENGDNDPVVRALNLLSMIDLRVGAHDRAEERLAETLKMARDSGDLWNEAMALGSQGSLAARQGDPATADTRYKNALMILRGMDHRWGVGITLIARGAVAEDQGDLLAADHSYRQAMDIQRDIGAAPELARCLAGVGRVAHGLGATGQAFDYLSEALMLSHSTGQRIGVSDALASIARVAAAQGLEHDAFRLAGAAVTFREGTGLPPSRRPWPLPEGTGEPGPGLVACWDEGRALSVDAAVALALGVADTARSPRPRPPAPRLAEPPRKALTPREHEIAGLVGEQLSNRAISERLFVAPATVARHIANINRKMGFNSRKQIAAWVSQHDGAV